MINRFFYPAYQDRHATTVLQVNAAIFLPVVIFLACLASLANAETKPALTNNQFLNYSIEKLLDINVVNVSSVTRSTQKQHEVPSAIFVITQDDIRRSGATSIPEALRMAPGVQVARINTDKWAIGIRGFNGFTSNKVQVLIDGRSDYSPLIAGALWLQQDTLLEDIDRIEIIRGPAASVWGTNAVNGVINIITKKASDTQGTFLTAGGGSFERGFLSARYGGKINNKTPFRLYAKGFTRDSTQSLTGTDNRNQWHSARAGFRLDHERDRDLFTLHGEFFYNALGDTLDKAFINLPAITGESRRTHQDGGYMRFRWDRTFSDKSSLWLQAAYDRSSYHLRPFSEYHAESVDIDFQHRFPLFDRNDFTWGLHYRTNINKVEDTQVVTFIPRKDTNHFFSGFIRNEFALIPDRLRFALGTRLDYNEFTGLEIQPNARLAWTPNNRHTVWLAVSRAVRTPSRSEVDAHANLGFQTDIPGTASLPFPIMNILESSRKFNSEKLIAYEWGYRHQFSRKASVDIAGFVNDYSQLRDFSFGDFSLSTGLPQFLIIPTLVNNNASALTYGFEFSADWRPIDKLHLQGYYSYLNIHVSSDDLFREFDPGTGGARKANPRHQLSLRSNYDLSDKLQLNLWLRYTSKIAFYDIPGYVTMDAKLAFRPTKNTELFLVGQNLFSENHREFVSDIIPSTPAYIPRGIYAGAQWRF